VTLRIQQATQRLKERQLAARNEVIMRRLHFIYAQEEEGAWDDRHKVHIQVDHMRTRLIKWKGQCAAESRQKVEAGARAGAQELRRNCAAVTSPYAQAPFLAEYAKNVKAFDAAKNPAYLTAANLFNSNAYDQRVRAGLLEPRTVRKHTQTYKHTHTHTHAHTHSPGGAEAEEADAAPAPARYTLPESARLLSRVQRYQQPRPASAPIAARR
jgi:hypothetical protein